MTVVVYETSLTHVQGLTLGLHFSIFSLCSAGKVSTWCPHMEEIPVQSVYCKKYPGGEKVVPFLWQRSEGH